MLALEGIKVISIEQAVAAPFASRQLADLGARVIKIERPGVGDFARGYDKTVSGMSSHFVWINRSKESLTLDIKAELGKEVLKDLLKDADVVIQNLAPGAMDRLGFSNEELHSINDKLIICNISGYGSYGPYVNKKAYDLLIQCEAGLLSITGTEQTPSKAGISIADIAAGMYAYSGILSSIIKRFKTGKGEVLDISMLEALGEWMGYPLNYSLYGGSEPERTGSQHATIYPYGPFKTANNGKVFLAIQNEREWKRFCEDILQRADLTTHSLYSTNSKRVENQESLKKLIEEILHNKSLEDVIEELETNKIANAQLKNMKQFANHEQLIARDRWINVETPEGVIQSLLPPTAKSEKDIQNKPIPKIGEHSRDILKELNRTSKEIGFLEKNNII